MFFVCFLFVYWGFFSCCCCCFVLHTFRVKFRFCDGNSNTLTLLVFNPFCHNCESRDLSNFPPSQIWHELTLSSVRATHESRLMHGRHKKYLVPWHYPSGASQEPSHNLSLPLLDKGANAVWKEAHFPLEPADWLNSTPGANARWALFGVLNYLKDSFAIKF